MRLHELPFLGTLVLIPQCVTLWALLKNPVTDRAPTGSVPTSSHTPSLFFLYNFMEFQMTISRLIFDLERRLKNQNHRKNVKNTLVLMNFMSTSCLQRFIVPERPGNKISYISENVNVNNSLNI